MQPRTDADHPKQAVGWTVLPLAVAVLLASLGTGSANVALPALAEAFGASFGAVQWVVLAYLLAMTALLVTAGRLGDLFGRKRLFMAGIALSAGAAVACALAPSLAVLAVARAVQGAGAAFIMAMAFALVSEAVPEERRGTALGVLGTMSSLGTMAGPVLGGFALTEWSWRTLFLLPVPLAVAAAAAALLLPSASLSKEGRKGLDWLGALLLAGTLALYTIAVTPGQAGALGSRASLALLAAAAACGGAFLVRQVWAPSPLVVLALFRDPVLAGGLSANTLVGTVMMATLVTGPFYLTLALGLPVERVGLVLAVGPLVAVLAGIPAGRLADHLGAQRVAAAGLVLLIGGTAWLSRAEPGQGVWGYVLPMAALSAGYAGFQSPNTAAVMARAAASERGAISGLLNLARNLGLLTGASLMGALFAADVGRVGGNLATASPTAIASGLRWCFQIGTAMGVGALLSALLPRAYKAP